MNGDIEKELRFFQAKKALGQHQMAGTADGQKLGDPLNDPEDDGLKESDGILLSRPH